MLMNSKKSFNEQALFIVQSGSTTAIFAILAIAVRINKAAIQFNFMAIMGVRIATTFLLLYLITADVQGFE